MLGSFFGVGLQLTDDSSSPAVTINAAGGITLIDCVGDRMRYRFGTPEQATVNWRGTVEYDGGKNPTVANNQTTVVEVHNSGSSGHEKDFWWNVSLYAPYGLDQKVHSQMYHGTNPSIAMNDAGFFVLVHEDPDDASKLSYITGYVSAGAIVISKTFRQFMPGSKPSVAVTGDLKVLIAMEIDGDIWTSVGTTDGMSLYMNPATAHTRGSRPAAGLAQNGYFTIAYELKTDDAKALRQLSGMLESTYAAVTANRGFDTGANASVALYDRLAVQVHEGSDGIFFTTARVEDRASWMQNHLGTLGGRTLRELVMPASHDAAMYQSPSGTAAFAQTQDERILRQLGDGMRWFDLRLLWTMSLFDVMTNHSGIPGPPLKSVLADVRAFIENGHRELIILKLSHFVLFNEDAYKETVANVKDAVGAWLYKTPLAPGQTLGQITLQQYLSGGACVLVLVDGNWAIDYPNQGFWVYRDEQKSDVAKGQLRVYDHFSDTEDFDHMKSEQLNSFATFTGTCSGDKTSTCDLFLLSWTLTPAKPWEDWVIPTPVRKLAMRADRQLGASMAPVQIPNASNRIINLVYVDYCEFARASDLALYLNGV